VFISVKASHDLLDRWSASWIFVKATHNKLFDASAETIPEFYWNVESHFCLELLL